jgi:hypothetical protein
MSTSRSFQDMLNQYLPNKLLKEEMIKRDYILTNIEKDDKWKGGKLIVPFKAAGASSIKMGGLTAANDVSEDLYVRGSIDDYKEMWGTMLFNHRDIMDHSGRIVEDSFLKILPDTIDDFMSFMKMTASVQMGTGPHFSTLVAGGTPASGIAKVSNIDRFCLNQKVGLKDNNSAIAYYYVTAIDVNADLVTLSATRGGAGADITAYTVAQAAKFYTDGADATYFNSIRDVLLSAANGGGANVHGQSKIAYPFLQAVNVDGSSITATNILDKLLDAYTEVRRKAKGRADRFLMSYKHFGSVLKAIENKANGAGNWNVSVDDKKASLYGWDEIVINTVKGKLTVVGIQEWDDDVIALLDMKSMVFRSNGFFQKRKSPEGMEYFEVRNTTGFQYLLDICLFGELEINKPGHNGIIYGISY